MQRGGQLYALLIGVNNYTSDELRPLEYAVADVVGFRQLLTSKTRLAADRCILLTSPQSEGSLTPTRSTTLQALDRLARAPMRPEDTFVLYFAGHGFGMEEESYLLTTDSHPGSAALLKETAISLRSLRQFLRSIRAGQHLMILDACRNEPLAARRDAGGTDWTSFTRDVAAMNREEGGTGAPSGATGRAILSACWEGQASHEYAAGGHGWFCHHLLNSIRAARGRHLEITPDWVDRLADRMVSSAWRELPPAAQQRPHLVLEGGAIRLPLSIRRKGPRGSGDTESIQPEGPDSGPEDAGVATGTSAASRSAEAAQASSVTPASAPEDQNQGASLEIPDLPFVPVELLELGRLCRKLEQEKAACEDASHPALSRVHRDFCETREARVRLAADLAANQPVWKESVRQKLVGAVAANPAEEITKLCAIVPGANLQVLLAYIDRLRNLELAVRRETAAEQAFEAARQRELERVAKEAGPATERLRKAEAAHLDELLAAFFKGCGEREEFPVAEWLQFQSVLAEHGMVMPERDLLARAADFHRDRREQGAWESASAEGSLAALKVFAKEWPKGRHAAEAAKQVRELQEEEKNRPQREAAEALAKEDASWENAQSKGSRRLLRGYLQEWPEGRHVKEAIEGLTRLRRKKWRRRRRLALAGLLVAAGYVWLFDPADWVPDEQQFLVRRAVWQVADLTHLRPAIGVDEPAENVRVNSLRMRFVSVPGTKVLFSVWETRGKDYEAFVMATRHEVKVPNFMLWPDHPMVNVSWEDATAFCMWLTEKERAEREAGGEGLAPEEFYRLPTDEEWSQAAGIGERETGASLEERSGKLGAVYPWGTESPDRWGLANCDLKSDAYAATAPVGSFKANDHGLYDLGGNVWEWCGPAEEPPGVSQGEEVWPLRGGSWRTADASELVTGYRGSESSMARRDDIGFRCVLEVADVAQ